MPTPTHLLIESRLGRDLGEFVTEQQAQGLGYRRIADILSECTDVAVSHESLRSWFGERAA